MKLRTPNYITPNFWKRDGGQLDSFLNASASQSFMKEA